MGNGHFYFVRAQIRSACWDASSTCSTKDPIVNHTFKGLEAAIAKDIRLFRFRVMYAGVLGMVPTNALVHSRNLNINAVLFHPWSSNDNVNSSVVHGLYFKIKRHIIDRALHGCVFNGRRDY